MKKLTRQSLDEMARIMPIIVKESRMRFVGGGNGTQEDPYTEEEYNSILGAGSFKGGYVFFDGGTNPAYLTANSGSEVTIVTYDPKSLSSTGVESYDLMYRGGFDAGYQGGKSGNRWDDVAVIVGSFVSAASAGTDFGDVNYEMIWYSQGLKDGYVKGLEARKYNNY